MFFRIGSTLILIASLLILTSQIHVSDAQEEVPIRICEGCHGFRSLHNIQIDSDGNDIIEPGSELTGYGHIGHNDDCWGCHGFLSSTDPAPGAGPVIPYISSSDMPVITAGTDTAVMLTGAAFTNLIIPPFGDPIEVVSAVELTAADGSVTSLTPDFITESEIVVTLPGTLSTGNYDVRAVKGPSKSNPTVISVKPDVTITDNSCDRKKGTLTISGYGFSKKPVSTDAYINVKVDGQLVDILSWSDTQIKASVSSCQNNANITVNALYGSDSNGGGKPPKPCKGRKCEK